MQTSAKQCASVAITLGALVLVAGSFAEIGGQGCLVEKKNKCTSSHGTLCQGVVTACSQGWENSAEGLTCIAFSTVQQKFYIWTGCAPGASNGGALAGYQDLGCGETGGQTCYCKTLVATTEGSDWYVLYSQCGPCDVQPGGIP